MKNKYKKGLNNVAESYTNKHDVANATPNGGNVPSPTTEYWFTKAELDKLMSKGSNFEEMAGLPLGSISEEYDIYKITANRASTTYRSTIAPTEQRGYTTNGGAQQTLVLDRSTWSNPVKYNTESFIPNF